MQFNSYEFILILLPATLLLYFTVGRINVTLKKLILCAAGLVLFGFGGIEGLAILLGSMVVNYYLCEIMLEKKWLRKPAVIGTVAVNILALLLFKYADFAIWNANYFLGTEISFLDLALPLGISFFTFQQIAYAVSLYRGEIESVDILDYASYVLYFPKLIMGPIVDPVKMIKQLNDKKTTRWDWEHFISGLKMFSFGLFKKLVIADTLAKAVTWGYGNYEVATSLDLVLVMLCYTLEIYFDFSGYTDMASGVSLMLNIELPLNFDSPYKALSVRDFWKRWHISLTAFFTKYLYIPLGGNRKGKVRTLLNVFIIFLISGIWHGANWTFILWGVLYGIMAVIDRLIEPLWNKLFKGIRWFLTFIVVNVMWLLFNASSIGEWLYMLKKIVLGGTFSISNALSLCFRNVEMPFFEDLIGNVLSRIGLSSLNTLIYQRGLFTYGYFWMFLFMISGTLICLLCKNNKQIEKKNNVVFMILAALAFAWSFLFLGTETVFIYNYF